MDTKFFINPCYKHGQGNISDEDAKNEMEQEINTFSNRYTFYSSFNNKITI